jgi:hypothetical protein
LEICLKPIEVGLPLDMQTDRVIRQNRSIVILIPGDTLGIEWEYEYFIELSPERLILLLPPKDSNAKYYARIARTLPVDFGSIRSGGELLLPFRQATGDLFFARLPLTRKMLVHALDERAWGQVGFGPT